MRDIQVSTGVFAQIWANRQEGENSEDEILQRLLLSDKSVQTSSKIQNIAERDNLKGDGFYDRRNDAHFPEGSLIFRIYKGKRYTAIAKSGVWHREDNHQTYSSLNQLNSSITLSSENVWNGNWKFIEGGNSYSIDVIRKRGRSV